MRAISFGLVLVLTGAGCAALLGDDFEIEDDAASGGAGGLGGSDGGSGASGGGGGSVCTLGTIGECGAAMKCTVIDYVTGEVACVTAGDHPAFTRCASDGECVDGTFCDPPSQVCLPICSHDPVCASGGVCVDAATNQSGTTFVAGMKVCTANCNPETGSPCDPIFGTMACIPFYVENGTSHFHCWQGGHLPLGSPCSDNTECAAGSTCLDAGNGAFCSAWCTPPGSTCAGGSCGTFVPPHLYDGNEYGICF